MRNQGVSLVSLIITIIVTIILAAIVIFSGMDTPERAQLANFGQAVSNVSSALVDQLTGVSTSYATKGQTRNTEQIYYTLATGHDIGQFGRMQSGDVSAKTNETGAVDSNCQRINPDYADNKTTDAAGGLGLTLPMVRETNKAWYVTEDGQVFNATGFVSGGRTYFNATISHPGELDMTATDLDNFYNVRAEAIATAIMEGKTEVVLSGDALRK